MRTEQCEVCKNDFNVKDLFLQWHTVGEVYVCKDCIEKHKQYETYACYAPDSDITFVFAMARIQLDTNFIELSQTLIGYHFGKKDKDYENRMLNDWITSENTVGMLRQSFNANLRDDEEVLY